MTALDPEIYWILTKKVMWTNDELDEIVYTNIDGESMSKVSAKTIQVAVADLIGILRGKILPNKNA